LIGFTDGSEPPAYCVDFDVHSPNSYAIEGFDNYYDLWLSGKPHKLECPLGPIGEGDVVGCGLLLDSKDELAIFFTLNGILLGNKLLLTHIIKLMIYCKIIGKKNPINPKVDRLYPTVSFKHLKKQSST
jgi:hypothetical protein